MTKFTDLLDDYLSAKKEFDAARARYEGYEFIHYYRRICERYEDAANALNSAFETEKGARHEDSHRV